MIETLERIFKAIEAIVKAEDEDLKDILKDYPEAEELIEYIEKFETEIAGMLREEKEYFVQAVQQYLQSGSTQNIVVQAVLDMVALDIFDGDPFDRNMSEAAKSFLTLTCQELTEKIMDAIDKDVPFTVLSSRTTRWIDSWSTELGRIMKLTSHEGVQRVLTTGIQEGKSIDKMVLEMADLPQFSRHRARMTAITETLTAYSVSQNEAYRASPAVTGKQWMHSGSKKNKPRPHHVALSGTVVGVDEQFTINGPNGVFTCDHPRDVVLPASERVNCHCLLSPVVDSAILGLTPEEKQIIRDSVITSLGE